MFIKIFFNIFATTECCRNMMIKGVITGDIIGSSNIKSENRSLLLDCLNRMNEELQLISPFKIEIFRGDSFQLLVDKPEMSIKLAILLRAGLIHHTPSIEENIWDAKISIGIGTVDFISTEIVTSDGEAFQYSGRQFDKMGKQRLVVKTPWSDVNEELAVSTPFADDIITKWSVKQAGMVYMSLMNSQSQKELADIIGTSAQNVSKVLATAKESLIKKYIERYIQLIAIRLK